jgi:DNA-binding transcriptional ArsR family regulator
VCAFVYNHLVVKRIGYTTSSERLDATFAALADPTRRAILARLASGDRSVAELAEPFDMSQPAVSKHLKVLERAGLITIAVDAQRRPRRFVPEPLTEAVTWLERHRAIWAARYEKLDALLDEMKRAPVSPTPKRRRPKA